MPSRHQVFKTASLLEATKGPNGVTVESILLFTGGSKSDVGPLLKEWRSRKRATVAVPAVVAAKAQRFAAELFALARWDADVTAEAANNSPGYMAEAPSTDLKKSLAKIRLELLSAADILDGDLAASPEDLLGRLDQLSARIALARDKVSERTQMEPGLRPHEQEPRAKRPSRRAVRADLLTPAVEKILLEARRPLFATDIFDLLSPSLQESFDRVHMGRSLTSRSRQGKIVQDEVTRKWRHLDLPPPSDEEQTKKRSSYQRLETERALTRGRNELWANEAITWLECNSGAHQADAIYDAIKDSPSLQSVEMDRQDFKRTLNRRCNYVPRLRRPANAAPYTFEVVRATQS